jgi:hypothetical protein
MQKYALVHATMCRCCVFAYIDGGGGTRESNVEFMGDEKASLETERAF